MFGGRFAASAHEVSQQCVVTVGSRYELAVRHVDDRLGRRPLGIDLREQNRRALRCSWHHRQIRHKTSLTEVDRLSSSLVASREIVAS